MSAHTSVRASGLARVTGGLREACERSPSRLASGPVPVRVGRTLCASERARAAPLPCARQPMQAKRHARSPRAASSRTSERPGGGPAVSSPCHSPPPSPASHSHSLPPVTAPSSPPPSSSAPVAATPLHATLAAVESSAGQNPGGPAPGPGSCEGPWWQTAAGHQAAEGTPSLPGGGCPAYCDPYHWPAAPVQSEGRKRPCERCNGKQHQKRSGAYAHVKCEFPDSLRKDVRPLRSCAWMYIWTDHPPVAVAVVELRTDK